MYLRSVPDSCPWLDNEERPMAGSRFESFGKGDGGYVGDASLLDGVDRKSVV